MTALDKIFGKGRGLRILVLTLSDRASRGEYEDVGGPRVKGCTRGKNCSSMAGIIESFLSRCYTERDPVTILQSAS